MVFMLHLTKNKLKCIIREELKFILSEQNEIYHVIVYDEHSTPDSFVSELGPFTSRNEAITAKDQEMLDLGPDYAIFIHGQDEEMPANYSIAKLKKG
jgi:hypothetical protein